MRLLPFFLILILGLSSGAQAQEWTRIGMGGGGWFMCSGAGPTGIILVGSDLSGAYRSVDGGNSWEEIQDAIRDFQSGKVGQLREVLLSASEASCEFRSTGRVHRLVTAQNATALLTSSISLDYPNDVSSSVAWYHECSVCC